MAGDVVELEENDLHDGQPLIQLVMRTGQRIAADITLDQIPEAMTTLEVASAYPVVISTALQVLANRLHAGRA